MNKTEQLEKFIKDNKLNFEGWGSDLNGVCCTISGYADFIGVGNTGPITRAIIATHHGIDEDNFKDELKTVFNFAYRYNYGNWWKTSEAKRTYKF